MTEPIALPLLRALARRYPSADAVLAEIGYLEGVLTLPKGSVHVVSDVHGEHKKLKHIVNNASGSLRPLVERLFAGRASADAIRDLLALVYYPREAYAWQSARPGFDRRAFLHDTPLARGRGESASSAAATPCATRRRSSRRPSRASSASWSRRAGSRAAGPSSRRSRTRSCATASTSTCSGRRRT